MMGKFNESLKQQLGKAKEAAGTAVDKMGELKEAGLSQFLDLKDIGIEKMREQFLEFSEVLPLLETAGFKVKEISIAMGLPPDVEVVFLRTHEMDKELMENLIESNKEKKVLIITLHALLAANNLQSKFTFKRFSFSEVTIKLGLTPEVSIKYE